MLPHCHPVAGPRRRTQFGVKPLPRVGRNVEAPQVTVVVERRLVRRGCTIMFWSAEWADTRREGIRWGWKRTVFSAEKPELSSTCGRRHHLMGRARSWRGRGRELAPLVLARVVPVQFGVDLDGRAVVVFSALDERRRLSARWRGAVEAGRSDRVATYKQVEVILDWAGSQGGVCSSRRWSTNDALCEVAGLGQLSPGSDRVRLRWRASNAPLLISDVSEAEHSPVT